MRRAGPLIAGLLTLSAGGAVAEPRPAALTSAEWRPAPRPRWGALPWQLLRLPERAVELATAPLLPVFTYAERYRVPQRLIDLLSNDDKTAFLFPYVTVGGTDGVAGGVMLMHNDLLGDNERFRLSGAVAHNLDFEAKTSYRQDVAWLNGRELGAEASYEEDSDVRYFPVGGDSRERDERAIRSDELIVSVHAELLPPSLLSLGGLLTLTYRRERLSTGERPGVPSLERGDPEVPPPPGFDHTVDLPQARLLLAFDTRDSLGRTRSGFLSRMALTAMRDFNGADLSAFRAELDLSVFVELLPRARVLVLNLGGGAATPWEDDHQLPWRGYVSLGRESHLRGYKRDRFRDRYAWWAGLEYHYPIYEHELDEIGIASVLFGDLGRAGSDADGLFGEAPRWSAGFGFQLDTARFSVFRLLVGFSPEGVELTVSAGELSFL